MLLPKVILLTISILLTMQSRSANPPIDWKIQHLTVVTSPKDRKRLKVGVGEKVYLGAPCPADWTIQGGGTLSRKTGISTDLTAPETASQVTITAKLHVDNSTKTVTFDVVEPNGMTFVKTANLLNASETLLQTGFEAKVYVTPADVNFTAISVGEESCKSERTGHYKNLYPNSFRHPEGATYALTSHEENKGTINIAIRDTVDTGLIPRFGTPLKYTSGTFLWQIPCIYELGSTIKIFTTVDQRENLTVDDENKTASLEVKKGSITSNTDTVKQ
jgi:hypothetical protein